MSDVLEKLKNDEHVNLIRADTVAVIAGRDDKLLNMFRAASKARE